MDRLDRLVIPTSLRQARRSPDRRQIIGSTADHGLGIKAVHRTCSIAEKPALAKIADADVLTWRNASRPGRSFEPCYALRDWVEAARYGWIDSFAYSMTFRCFLLAVWVAGTAGAAEWEATLATVASLRTAGARLVSSDAIDVGSGRYALITYWESRSSDDVDFYRCVDITDSAFDTVRQDCWKALRPTGRAPETVSDVTSSSDICGRRSSSNEPDSIAFCAFSRSFVVSTPHFAMTLFPFENGGMVAVREQGRHLIVVDEDLPASVLLEVRADALADRGLSRIASTQDLARQPPDESECEIDDLAGTQWAVCQPEDSSTTLVRYLIEADTIYQLSFGTDASASDRATVRLMTQSFRPKSR